MSCPVEGLNNQSEPGSSHACLVLSAGNYVGSWDMSMVSICFVCDIMLRHGFQAELSSHSGRLNCFDDPAASYYLFLGTSFQDTSDSSLSSHFFSQGSLFIDKELYESQLYAKELEQKVASLKHSVQHFSTFHLSRLPVASQVDTDRHMIHFRCTSDSQVLNPLFN